jgi:hypothetical protein
MAKDKATKKGENRPMKECLDRQATSAKVISASALIL